MYKKLPHFIVPIIALTPLVLQAEGEGGNAKTNQPSQAVSSHFQPFTGKITASKVRLRTQPSKESSVVRELNSGDMIGILQEQAEFYTVRPPKGVKGYVFRTFVLDNVVEGEKVNIRLHPDTESPVIGKLHAGDRVDGAVCATNSKWLEITLPETTNFYIAKDYVEKVGAYEMLADIEGRFDEAMHKLNAVFHFAKAEIQKPFEDVSFDTINQKFEALSCEYRDIPEIVERAKEANNLIEETYLQKKIVFLESKADRSVASKDLEMDQIQKLSQMSRELKLQSGSQVSVIGDATSMVVGQSNIGGGLDKNTIWQSLEESIYHLWAATNDGKSMEDFYQDAATDAIFLTGVVEPYTRPVKNRPGDYLLRNESLQPVAFLYSTKINLQDVVGKKVTLVSSPRPNNNFAFPAYYILGVE